MFLLLNFLCANIVQVNGCERFANSKKINIDYRLQEKEKRKMKRFISFALATILSFSLVACNTDTADNGSDSTEGDVLSIYTSFYPMYEFTQEIVGDTAEVVNIMPPGSASHGWEPSARQVVELSEADVLVYQGVGMEEWIDDVKATLEAEGSDIIFIEAAEGLDLLVSSHTHDHDHDQDHDHDHGDDHDDHDDHDHGEGYDPHVWLSVRSSIEILSNIKDALVEIDGENAEAYNSNYEEYKSELEALDEKYTSELISADVDSFMITHEAFGYLARDFNLTQYGLSGMGTEQDPNPEKMAEMIDIVESEGMKAIYFDDAGSDKIALTLAAELADVEVLPLTTLHSPTQAEMDAGLNYIKAMETNLENLLANAK